MDLGRLTDDDLLAATPGRPGQIAGRRRCSESVVRQRVSRGLATLREISDEAP